MTSRKQPFTHCAPAVIMQHTHTHSHVLIHTKDHFEIKWNENEETDEWGGGQLGVYININISNPPTPTLFQPPLCARAREWVCVCVSLTTSGCVHNGSYEPRCLLFLSPVALHQLSVAWSAWLPGLVGCPPARLPRLSAPRLVPPALRRRRGRECHSTQAARVEQCKQ